jgi:hypothetical protein
MEKRYDRREAAAFLTAHGFKTSPKTLQKQATVGGGPDYQIYGNRAVYTEEALLQHAQRKLSPPRRSTSQSTQAA